MPKLPKPGPLSRPAKPGERVNGGSPNGNGAGPVDLAKEAGTDVVGWLDERTGGTNFLTAMLYRKVPKGTNWFYTLGSATLFAFVFQALTGVFLAMYYTPSPTQAYGSITHLTNDVWLGEFVRGMHKWGASVMIIGVVLLILTLVMGLTGYLLPFDQRSYWATIVANNITGTGPVLGPYLADFLRAGPEIGATTLSRFYAIHMLLVPGLIIALIGAHLYLVVKLGTTAPPWMRAEKPKSAIPKQEVG
jgi:menaquinol-cytochrome c reductase cytochrome b subunit